MRNEWKRRVSRPVCNLHAHKHLQRLAAKAHSDALRKIRDLIIFRENQAQMRNKAPDATPQPASVRFLCLLRDLALAMHSLARKGTRFSPFTSVQRPACAVALQNFCAPARPMATQRLTQRQ
jgi:hypothetical protein